ncbi:hypothetical protein Glove_37g136 [Diversispora epigaea]|uniref:BTB domain-containing protein n=1 Tax=Diversispora epigaea TaxID=1348612 RepID=A0A397JJA6_9GLOM|nr:hypothetical protein Glove_37g136 [Diversispora epigaea]
MTTKFYDRLSNDLTQLLENPIDNNVKIEVGEEPTSQIFEVHSYILQSRSLYFKKKFNESPFNENHVKELKMPNISTKVFNMIIKYIYGGTVSLENLEISNNFDLLIASHELELDELVEHLQNHLVANNSSWLRLNFSHVCQTSFRKNFEIIQKFCNDIIVKHPDTVFESENFNSLPEDVLISIIRLDDLQLEEDKIWDYVIQWGKAKNPTLPADFNEWTSDNFLTFKTTLKHCLPHIRYFNIPSEQVVEKLYPYYQLFEPRLLLDINTKLLVSEKPISSTILPPRNILNAMLPSNLITDEHALEISSWIDRKEILYTENNPYGSKNGFDIKTIFENCDKVSKTVIVAKVKGTREIIGGYNPLEIRNNVSAWYYSKDSFVFSLKTKNLNNSILSRVTNYTAAIYYDSSNPCLKFGNALNFYANLKTGRKCFCGTDYYEEKIRSSSDKFKVEEFEVLKVSPAQKN